MHTKTKCKRLVAVGLAVILLLVLARLAIAMIPVPYLTQLEYRWDCTRSCIQRCLCSRAQQS